MGCDAAAASTAEMSVKGTLMAARRRFVAARYGDDASERVRAALEGRARELYDNAISFSWYPLTEMVEIDRAILSQVMDGDLRAFDAFGEEVALHDLPTIYRVLLRVGSPGFLLKRAQVAYGAYFRGGRIQHEGSAAGEAGVIYDGLMPYYLCRYAVGGWLRAAVGLTGTKDVVVTKAECAHHGHERCRWHIDWAE